MPLLPCPLHWPSPVACPTHRREVSSLGQADGRQARHPGKGNVACLLQQQQGRVHRQASYGYGYSHVRQRSCKPAAACWRCATCHTCTSQVHRRACVPSHSTPTRTQPLCRVLTPACWSSPGFAPSPFLKKAAAGVVGCPSPPGWLLARQCLPSLGCPGRCGAATRGGKLKEEQRLMP